MFVLSYIILYNITPQALGWANVGLTGLSVIVVGLAVYGSCMYMKNAVILSEQNIRASEKLSSHLKRIVSFTLLMALMGFAVSIVGGFIFSYAIGFFTTLRINDFQLFCTVVKIPLFIGFIIFLVLLSRRTGADDATLKSFNPHVMLIALIFSFAFMVPVTVSDHMYGHSEAIGGVSYSNPSGHTGASDPGKIIYNVQTVFSSNIDLYRDNHEMITNEKFSNLRVIISILLSTAIQIFAAMTAYNMGRKKYDKTRPSRNTESSRI